MGSVDLILPWIYLYLQLLTLPLGLMIVTFFQRCIGQPFLKGFHFRVAWEVYCTFWSKKVAFKLTNQYDESDCFLKTSRKLFLNGFYIKAKFCSH
jgi:hypothetical protein